MLVAPLDWGLGHATRCIPIIRELLEQGCEVTIGSGPAAQKILQEEFPDLRFLPLLGYNVHYSRYRSFLPLVLLLQIPKLIFRVYFENRWLKKAIATYGFNAVISDNRPGLYHPGVKSVYITHQLCIKTGNRFTQWLAQKIHYRFIHRFSECWVPDLAGDLNLAGDLSHPLIMPRVPVKYLGPLSRFEKKGAEKKYDLAILLSGPEPQRTLFENLILKELENYNGKAWILRGLPEQKTILLTTNKQVEIRNHLPSAELNQLIESSELVICRSGYSSVMDLVKLQQRAVLVPTPGQTEQEYLGEYLMSKKMFYGLCQEDFSLNRVMDQAGTFTGGPPEIISKDLKAVVRSFIDGLKKG